MTESEDSETYSLLENPDVENIKNALATARNRLDGSVNTDGELHEEIRLGNELSLYVEHNSDLNGQAEFVIFIERHPTSTSEHAVNEAVIDVFGERDPDIEDPDYMRELSDGFADLEQEIFRVAEDSRFKKSGDNFYRTYSFRDHIVYHSFVSLIEE